MNPPLRELYRVGRAEARDASLPQKAMLGANVVGLAFQWSPANEALSGLVASNAYQATHNILVTSVASGAVAFAEQGVLATMAAVSVEHFPRVIEQLRRHTTEEANRTAPRSSKFGRFVTAFAFGANAVVAKESATNSNTLEGNVKLGLGSSALVGGGVATIAALGSGAAELGSRYGFEAEADVAVNILSNPLSYLAAFGAYYGGKAMKHRLVPPVTRGISSMRQHLRSSGRNKA